MDFVKRPVAVFAASFFALFCFYTNLCREPTPWAFVPVGTLLFISLVPSFAAKGKLKVASRYASLILSGALAAVIFAASVFFPARYGYSYLADGDHVLCGTVRETLWSSFGQNCYFFDVTSADGEEASFGAALVTSAWFESGDTARAKCEVSNIKNSDTFDTERYYLSKGIVLTADAETAYKTGNDTSVSIFFTKLSEKLSVILHKNLSFASAGVADAVLLGNRAGLSDGTKSDFSRIGISHLVAISGMHVSFICLALTQLLRRLRIGRKKISVVVILAMIFYMFLTGFAPSVTRAGLLCCAVYLISFFGISYDGVTVLSLCGAAMVIADPFVSFSAAMQLSFAACAGCFAGGAILRRIGLVGKQPGASFFKRLVRFFEKSFISTIVIVLFTLPVTLLYFDKISLLTPVSNLVFIPAFSVILYLAALVLIFSPIAPLCGAAALAADKFIGAVLWASDKLASVKGCTVSLRYPFSPYIVAAACAFTVAIVIGRKKMPRIAALGLACCIVFYGAGVIVYESNRPSVELVRAGNLKGEAVMIISGGETLLCDLSYGSKSVIGAAEAALDELCITDIDSYIVTSYGVCQKSLLKYVIETMNPNKVYFLSDRTKSDSIKEMITVAREYEVVSEILPVMPESFKFNFAELSFSGVTSENTVSKQAVCFKVSGAGDSVIYLGSGWTVQHPNAVSALGGADSIIFGSSGASSGKAVTKEDAFYKCKIYSFADAANVYSFPHTSTYDANSTLVLNMDKEDQ